MTTGLDAGLLWIERRIRELSKELNRPVDCMELARPGDPTIARSFVAHTIPLKIWRGGEIRIIEFRRSELRDVEKEPTIQHRLEEQITVALLGPKPRA